MADKFSLDDIVAEYTGRSVGKNGDDVDVSVDDIIEETNNEIRAEAKSEDTDGAESVHESIFTASETENDIAEEDNEQDIPVIIPEEEESSFENPAKKLFDKKAAEDQQEDDASASEELEKKRNDE